MTLRNEDANAASVAKITLNEQTGTGTKPDVYYIILDMYGRDDVLKDRFSYDNSEFLKELEELGFVVTPMQCIELQHDRAIAGILIQYELSGHLREPIHCRKYRPQRITFIDPPQCSPRDL